MKKHIFLTPNVGDVHILIHVEMLHFENQLKRWSTRVETDCDIKYISIKICEHMKGPAREHVRHIHSFDFS